MKLRLALLAVPFLALACSDSEQATLLDPPAISADVTTEAAPVAGTFTLEVGRLSGPCAFPPNELAAFNDPDWTLLSSSTIYCIVLDIEGFPGSKKGVVVYQQCISKSTGNHVSRTECANKTGAWKTFGKPKTVNPAGITAITTGIDAGTAEGWRLKYRAKGAGVKNRTVGPLDVIRPAG
jgi:hypothetical protein